MTRQSIKLPDKDWQALDELAAATGSTYRGRPAWRAMLRRIARHEIAVRSAPVKGPKTRR